jgi:methylglutaconyl-CoA hydratase
MNSVEQGYVSVSDIVGGVVRISFYHPAHNSLPGQLLSRLASSFEEVGRDAGVRVIVLESREHKVFCSGASFDELAAIDSYEVGTQFFEGFGNLINAMRKCPKIILGRVHGKLVGGGVGLAAATDYCVGTRFAAIRLSELAVGFGPFVIGPAVVRKMGLAAFSKLALTPGEWQSADWACTHGLFLDIFDTTEEMDTRIEGLCAQFSDYNPEALTALKTILWEGTDDWDELLRFRAGISGRMSQSQFTRDAIAAFKRG